MPIGLQIRLLHLLALIYNGGQKAYPKVFL